MNKFYIGSRVITPLEKIGTIIEFSIDGDILRAVVQYDEDSDIVVLQPKLLRSCN